MKKYTLALVSLTLASFHVGAQTIGPSTINAAGGRGALASNEFEWSVGEMALVSTFSNPSIVVTQGVLQPVEKPTSATAIDAKLATVNVFPNPSSSIVNLTVDPNGPASYTYRLMDITGKLLVSKTQDATTRVTEQINLSALACATYMLEVVVKTADSAPQTTSFKIEKIN